MNCNCGSFRPRHSAGLSQRLGRQVEGKERFMNFERRVVWCAAFILLMLSVLADGGRAQTEKGTITGTVVDTSGAVLQGAEVVLSPVDVHAVSNEQGRFFFNNLTPNHYTITITYVGFAAFVKEDDVTSSQPISFEAKMTVSSVEIGRAHV